MQHITVGPVGLQHCNCNGSRGFFPSYTQLGLMSFEAGAFEEAAQLFESAAVGDPEAENLAQNG